MEQKRYIMCHCPLTYYDNIIFVMFYIKMSRVIVFLSNLESVIYWYFLSQFLKQSNNYINFDFQYRSKPKFEVTQLPLSKISKHWTAEQYQGSADHGELDLKLDVNRPASGKLLKSTTVSSQCEIFS